VQPLFKMPLPDCGTSLVRVHWTTELVAELATLWVAGHNTQAIAKALGMSRSSIIGKVKTLRPTESAGRRVTALIHGEKVSQG
jgi:hypothetical protein